MFVRPIEYDSPEYHAARELRRRFLREPLGLPLSDSDVAGEDEQHHFGLFEESTGEGASLVGGVIGKADPEDLSAVRIRQMVVHGDHRGRGHGRFLLAEAERALTERGYSRFVLYARAEAAPFYERCGYASTGATAELIGLEHQRMEKRTT